MKSRAERENFIIGIDEVGRGSLAGPVTVAAIAIPKGWRNKSGLKLRDSKRLSISRREAWYAHLKNSLGVSYSVSHVRPAMIDKINISNAANLAAYRALQKLFTKNQMNVKPSIFLDGGLYMRNSIQKTSLLFKSRTVVKGDEKIPAIALASIIAKVRRDALMKRLHKKHTHYGFDAHKGYGTRLHLLRIKKFGVSKIHRRSFGPVELVFDGFRNF